MNRSIIILLTIFLMFASFVLSVPYPSEYNDPLSGFEECKGDYPDIITLYKYSPNPVVVGQPVTIHIAGYAPVPIKEGSLIKVTRHNDEQTFHEEIDFCKDFVEQSSKCPIKGHFNLTAIHPTMTSPSDPKNTVVNYRVKISGK